MTNPSKASFSGFHDSPRQLIPVPESFFTQVLPLLVDPEQIKLLLCLFKMLNQQERLSGYFREDDILSNPLVSDLLGEQEQVKTALKGLITQNILLFAKDKHNDRTYYFLNHPQAETAVKAINAGHWQESEYNLTALKPDADQPNIFKLYEENIGAITPMMAEILKEDEKAYPTTWIEEAIRLAVTRNARNWKYVQAILDRWQKEGRGNEQNRRDDSQDPDSYRESWLGRK